MVSRECQCCPDVRALQVGDVGKDLVFAHAAGQVVEHVMNRDPQPTKARLAPRLLGSMVMRSR